MNMSAMLPPPPPPPLPSEVSVDLQLQRESTMDNFHIKTPVEMGQDAYKFFKEYLDKHGRGREENCYLTFSYSIQPMIQKGPQCGMVALAMASPLLSKSDVSAEKIYLTAKSKGYTKQGELFSADYLSRLAHQVLNCHSEVLEMVDGRKTVLKQLLKGSVLLVPYDADKNHGPCRKKGHKAHWAVISGFFIMMDMTHLKTLKTNFVVDKEYRHLYYCSNIKDIETCEEELLKSTRSIVVFGHQGKSKHTSYWFLNDLLDSNANLLEVDPERDAMDFVIPQGGVVEGLCGKIVGLTVK